MFYLSKMALVCHAVLTSRIKGHHAYNHNYFVGEELICELEFTISAFTIQLRSRAKTKMSQSVTFLKPWQLFYFHFVKREEKFMKFKQKSLRSQDLREKGIYVFGEVIEIPCQYTIYVPKNHEKNYKRTKKSTVVNFTFMNYIIGEKKPREK